MTDAHPTQRLPTRQSLPDPAGIPRIALFISDPELLLETETILREHYSSLLLITEQDKLKEFSLPLIIILDSVRNVAALGAMHLPEGTQILVLRDPADSEATAAAFEVGATDYLPLPLSRENVIVKTESYLEAFRSPPSGAQAP
ncbi:MAG: hypothetical protein PHC88_03890 [Terrimicrobiaceae bacterium]|nr:hypothetical protein [Terrimicrobiaceae bacterium]